MPSLLIGVGCMMFLSEKMGLRPRAWGEGRRPMVATADDPYGASGERSRVSEAAGRVSDTAGRVSEAAGRVSDAARRMTGSAPASARLAAASAGSSLTSAAEAVALLCAPRRLGPSPGRDLAALRVWSMLVSG